MTDPIDIEPILDDWLGVGSDVLPDRSVDAVLRTVRQTTQRGAWRAPWRTTYMHNIPRLAVAGATLVAVLAVGGLLLRGSPSATGGAGHGPVQSVPPTPSGTPAPSAASAAPAYETPLGIALVGIDGTLATGPRTAIGCVESGPERRGRPRLPSHAFEGRGALLRVREPGRLACGRPGRQDIRPLHLLRHRRDSARLPGHRTAVSWRTNTRARTATSTCTWSPSSMTVPDCPVATPGASPPTRPSMAGRRGRRTARPSTTRTTVPRRRIPSGFSETQEIWRVPATGGTPQRLTDNAVADLQPDVAADGTVVYWGGDEIWTMAADGTKQHRLAAIPPNIGFNPRWSPDGSKIAVLQYDGSKRALFDPAIRQDADLALLRVVVVDVATGDTTTVGPRVASFFNPVSWTPDGTALLINRYDDGPWDQPDLCGRERGQKDCVGRPDGRRRRSTMRRTSRMRSVWSGREDLNLRPHRPERCALPSCATPRPRVPVVTGPPDDSAAEPPSQNQAAPSAA